MRRNQFLVRRTALGMLATAPFGLSARSGSAASVPEMRQAQVLAAASFTDERNNPHHLSELTRPLLLVNLWAAWCVGCRVEMPTIQALTSRLGPAAIDVVLVSHDMNWSGDLAYARHARLSFHHWRLSTGVSETAVATAFRIEGGRFALPQSLLFAGHGRVMVACYEGSQDWAAPEQVRLIERWLETAE